MSYNYWCLRFDETYCVIPILLSQDSFVDEVNIRLWLAYFDLLFSTLFFSLLGEREEKEKEKQKGKELPTVSGILGAFT